MFEQEKFFVFKNDLSNPKVIQDLIKKMKIICYEGKKNNSLTDCLDKRVKNMKRSIKSHDYMSVFLWFEFF